MGSPPMESFDQAKALAKLQRCLKIIMRDQHVCQVDSGHRSPLGENL